MHAVFVLIATLVAGGQGLGVPSFGHFPVQAGFGFSPYGGFASPKVLQVKQEKPLQLSCVGTYDGGYGPDSIAASIKEKRDGYGPGGGIGHGPFASSFLNFGGAFGHASSGALEAVFELFSSSFKGGKVSIIVTEKGYVGGGCYAENFGPGLSSSGAGGAHGLAGGPGHFGAGVGALGFPGAHGGFASPHQFFAGKGGYGPEEYYPDGVLAEVDLIYNTPKVISLDRLRDYSDLKQLAGRGLIACTDVESDYLGRANCVGSILACCALSYDHQDRGIVQPGYQN